MGLTSLAKEWGLVSPETQGQFPVCRVWQVATGLGLDQAWGSLREMGLEAFPEPYPDRCRVPYPKLPDEAAKATNATVDRESPFLQ
jgi:hypothetical protein